MDDADTSLHTPRPTVPEIGESGDEGAKNPLDEEPPKTPTFDDDEEEENEGMKPRHCQILPPTAF